MKQLSKLFLALVVAMLPLGAQGESPKKHAVLANIGTVAIGNYEMSYEHRLDKHLSLSVMGYYYDSRKVLWQRVFSYGYSLGLGFAPKFHVYGHALENSFYLSPHVKLGYLVHPATKEEETTTQDILLRTGAVFGYAHVFDFGLMVDANAGLEHYHSFPLKKATRMANEKALLIRPTISLALGWAF